MAKLRKSRIVQHALALSALCASACGGTFSEGGGGGSGGASGAGGDGGKGGACTGEYACAAIACRQGFVSVVKPGECCPSCVPGGTGGATGSGGSAGDGGGCGLVFCPAIDCGGSLVTLPGDCCPSCLPGSGGAGGAGGGSSCSNMPCPAYDCAQGYHLATEVGQCCPTCVPDADACTLGQQGYKTLLGTVLNQPNAESCQVDKDCTLLQGNPSCGDVCAANPISVAWAAEADAKLKAYAMSACSTCVAIYPPCAAPPAPACVGGTCTLYRPL